MHTHSRHRSAAGASHVHATAASSNRARVVPIINGDDSARSTLP
jgi:hypothetical protein